MTKTRDGTRITGALVMAAATALAGLAPAALAQAQTQNGSAAERYRTTTEAPPFESTSPGQTPVSNTGDPARDLSLGVLHWAPIESQCGFTGGPDDAPEMRTDETQPLVFVTMASPTDARSPRIERGYIMANGIVRELERGKSAPNKEGTVTTMWRSAGEPRINVSVAIDETRQSDGATEYDGSMTVHWGDRREVVEIQGRCIEHVLPGTDG